MATLDLAKIQIFFFTLVLVLCYAIALGAKLQVVDAARAEAAQATVSAPVAPMTAPAVMTTTTNPHVVDEFPLLDMGFVTLLGISNAGFLVNGAIPRTQPAP